MESKPNTINAYLKLYLTISFFLDKWFLRSDLLINYPSISEGLTEDVHGEMFNKYAWLSLTASQW